MKKQDALKSATDLLLKNGYTISGTTVTAPEVDSPLDAISIQNELSDIIYAGRFVFQLQYIGNKLKLIGTEV